MKLTKSKLKEIIREEIRSLKEMKELSLSDPAVDIEISGNKILIEFDSYDWSDNSIRNWVKGNDDRVGEDIDDLLEKHKLRLDWDKKVKMEDKWTIRMFVKKF